MDLKAAYAHLIMSYTRPPLQSAFLSLSEREFLDSCPLNLVIAMELPPCGNTESGGIWTKPVGPSLLYENL